jgi:hypothetical protein
MVLLTIPKNFKFKPLFPLLVSVTTTVRSVNVEMVVETLISDTIELIFILEKPLIRSPES